MTDTNDSNRAVLERQERMVWEQKKKDAKAKHKQVQYGVLY